MFRPFMIASFLSISLACVPTKAQAVDPNVTYIVIDGIEYLYILTGTTPTLVPLGPATPAVTSGAIVGGLPVVILGGVVAIGLAGTYLYYETQLANATNQGTIGQPANNPTDYEVNYWTQLATFYGFAG